MGRAKQPEFIYIEPYILAQIGKRCMEYSDIETEFKTEKYIHIDVVKQAIAAAKKEAVEEADDFDDFYFENIVYYIENKGYTVVKEHPVMDALIQKFEFTDEQLSMNEMIVYEKVIEFLQKHNPQELINFLDNYK